MFENEFFGHVQGAYTDAKSNRQGLIARAQHGTLFLDEVDGLPPKAQITLLRFLEDRKYRRLGDTALDQADVSIIAATNVCLEQRVADGNFRQDLLFRLATVRIKVPTLRERRSDIALLARHYVYYLCELYELPPKRLSPSFVAWLQRQDWPGNIRELQNCLHRELLLAEGDVVHGGHSETPAVGFTLELSGFDPHYDDVKRAVVQDFERQYLDQVMRHTKGNVSQAARLIRKDRRVVGRLLDKNGIDRTRYL
jgi:DNA-binding NtrC family response regulator